MTPPRARKLVSPALPESPEAEVARLQARAKEVYAEGMGPNLSPESHYYAAQNYHRAVMDLRAAQAELELARQKEGGK